MKKRTVIALLGTIAWFVLAAYWVYSDWTSFHKLAFNEKGDFLAGFISPAVFLWLIIGYFQQGEELQQNTDALRIQADELKNSVTEYKALVEATKRQVELIEQEHKERRAQEIRLNQLIPRYVGGSSTARGGFREHVIKIANMGQSVTEVSVSCSVLGTSLSPQYVTHFDRGTEKSFSMQFPIESEESGFIAFRYVDGLGRPSEALIFFKLKAEGLKIGYQPQEMS